MREFKSKKTAQEVIKIDDVEYTLNINLNSGNLMECIRLTQIINKNGEIKHFIELSKLIFGEDGFEILNNLSIEDFGSFMGYISYEYIAPEAEKISKGKSFDKRNYQERKYGIE